MASCTHLDRIRDVQPDDLRGCPDCLVEGSSWVHLRVCLQCGHVGCCDSSPRRHASGHYSTTDHPIIASMEPGEDWRWCFVDELLV